MCGSDGESEREGEWVKRTGSEGAQREEAAVAWLAVADGGPWILEAAGRSGGAYLLSGGQRATCRGCCCGPRVLADWAIKSLRYGYRYRVVGTQPGVMITDMIWVTSEACQV